MDILTKDVEHLGFKGGLFARQWHAVFNAVIREKRRVVIIDNVRQQISHFDLSEKHFEEYSANKIALVPEGCCCATGRPYIEHPTIDFMGDFRKAFKTKKKLVEYIESLCK